MAGPEFRWIRYHMSVPSSSPVLALAQLMPSDAIHAETAAEGFVAAQIELPDLSPWPTPKEKAEILLRKAAEVEHSLMVQYLYARYSLTDDMQGLSQPRQISLMVWKKLVTQIAKEEMAHLMVVQNLRLLLELDPTFERDDFPVKSRLFPFEMHLEPLTQNSLAKYIVAEAPLEPMNVPNFPAIVRQATGAAGAPINHVGVLYALLGVVFASGLQEIEQDASGGDPWYQMVQIIAHLAYCQQPSSSAWNLPSEAFHPESQPKQASAKDWAQGNAGMRIPLLSSRQDAKDALRDIGLQGEGPAPLPDAMMSHFDRFVSIYSGKQAGTVPFPANESWPTIEAPTDPQVTDDPLDPNGISDPIARDWAELANLRYALLLGFLEQYFLTNPADRGFLHAFAVRDSTGMFGNGEMLHLKTLSRKLVALKRSSGEGKAALPFKLPDPSPPPLQWQVHINRMQRAIALEEKILASHGHGDPILKGIHDQDLKKLDKLKQVSMGMGSAGGGGGGQGDGSVEIGVGGTGGGRSGTGQRTRFDRVRDILNAASGDGQPSHSGAGRFWNRPRDAFLQTVVYGLKVVETQGENRGARSNLIKALKGEAPFDGTDFERMPLGRPPVSPENIAFIQKWIEDGCPEDPDTGVA